MPRFLGVRWQTALVVALFVASLAILLVNFNAALSVSGRESEVREQIRKAGMKLATVADARLPRESVTTDASWAHVNGELRAAASQVLAAYPEIEGGFYDGAIDRFGGFAFPTSPHGPAEESRTDPPPLEAPYIRLQARQSLVQPADGYLLAVRDVGPSRVMLFTQAVGTRRPARVAVWLLHRLIGPEQTERQLHRYQVSNGLALGGMALALVLTVNLRWTLKRQRQAEERLREELRRSEHLAALGKLLAGVAHEVRNPLAGIRSTVQLWQRLPETLHAPGAMDAILHSVDRLNDIVTRLLFFSRADSSERHPVEINSLLTETLKLLEAKAAEQHVTVATSYQADLPAVSGSAAGLQQVFLNLATNALQAMPDGGTLRCETRHDPRRGTVTVRFQDSGPGISAEDRSHLFEPFFTTRPEGTGLGLALCREIVLQHGGQIELEESAGPGTRFAVTLPTIVPRGN